MQINASLLAALTRQFLTQFTVISCKALMRPMWWAQIQWQTPSYLGFSNITFQRPCLIAAHYLLNLSCSLNKEIVNKFNEYFVNVGPKPCEENYYSKKLENVKFCSHLQVLEFANAK